MSTIRKSITFTAAMNQWMQALIEAGEYTNESEYVRDLIRQDKERSAKHAALKTSIQQGLDSGISTEQITDIMKRVEGKLSKDGKL